MPAAIPAIAVSGFALGVGIIGVETFVFSVMLAGVSAIANEAAMDGSQLADAFAKGSRFNVTNNVEPIPVVYGYVDHASGAVAWRVSHSGCPTRGERNTDLLTTIVVWGEGEINDIAWLYFNDIESTDDRFVHGTTLPACLANLGNDDRRVWITNYLGTDDQLADETAVAIAAANPDLNDKWSVDHRLRGIAYSRVTLRFESGLYGPDAIPIITASLWGKKCYDWRTATTAWTDNPAIILYDYLTNTRYGCGFLASEIDLASFSEAANYCEVYVVALGLDGARKRYTCNGSLSTTDSRLDNVRKILACCRGNLIYSGGLYKLRIDKPEVAVFDLNDTNLTGAWSISLDSYGRRFNRVTARFINPAKEWQPDMVVVDSEAYRLADRGELLETEIDLAMCTSRGQALDIAGMALRQSRYSIGVEVTATLVGLRCEVGDVVTVTHEVPGWSGKLFRVQRMDLLNTDEVRIGLLEYSLDVYDITNANEVEIPPGTTLPDSRFVYPPTNLVLGQGGSDVGGGARMFNINAIWEASTSPGVVGYDIEWGPDSPLTPPGTPSWTAMQIGGGESITAIIPPVVPGVRYAVRIRARNWRGITSDWLSDSITILPLGRISPVAQASATQYSAGTGRISWTPPDDWRASYVEVWSSTTNDFNDSATPPVLALTVPMNDRYMDVSHVGVTRWYWLRTSYGTGLAARKSEGWTPSEYGDGLVITG